jgi:CBS domain-containing protein
MTGQFRGKTTGVSVVYWQVEGEHAMKVKEIMTPDVKVCAETANLARAAELMSQNNCGILPVVTIGGKVVGLITDRDICVAAAKKDRSLASLSVDEVVSRKVHACRPEDDVQAALGAMREYKVRRLPVIDAEGVLKGILSMDDVLRNAEEVTGRKATELSYGDAVKTYQAILAGQAHGVAA